jgi:hypothetical protein
LQANLLSHLLRQKSKHKNTKKVIVATAIIAAPDVILSHKETHKPRRQKTTLQRIDLHIIPARDKDFLSAR